MKRRKILLGALLLFSATAFSQVGVGIKEPHKSTLLHLENKKNEYRGVFMPNVPLESTKDASLINKGNVLNSLLVYNTTDNDFVKPGFYYWKDGEWIRVISSKDILENLDSFPKNKTMAVKNEKGVDVLYVEDTRGHQVSVPVSEVNIVTTLEDKGNGRFTFTNEEGTETTIDVVGSVVENISEILKENTVKEQIFETVAAQGKALENGDKSILVEGGEQAVLANAKISVANKGITTKKIKPGGNKQLLITNVAGKVEWVDANDEVIKEAVKANETVTVLADKGDGTFWYYNEKAVDANGQLIDANAVKFDANTLKIVEKADEKGVYVFYDGHTSIENPLMKISTRANSIIFDNSSTIIEGDNVQEVIENIITKIEVAQGTPSSLKGDGILINGQEELAESVLKEMILTIADGAITTEKIEAGGKKQILITNNNGDVVWVDASDEVIKEAVKANETVTILEDKGNGTFVYYNEDAIDKTTGKLIKKKGVKFDANTLSIIETAEGSGVFNFYDKSKKEPIATINVKTSVINNIEEILGDTNVQNNIYTTVANKGQAMLAADKSILVEGGDKAVLNEMQISVANKGITTKKIKPGGNKQLLITNVAGKVEWVDANDEVIKEAVKANETVTVLADKGDGTFWYYNEKAVDANGQLIDANAVKFDANTLKIVEKEDEKGVYVFYDGHTSIENPLMKISTRANSIIFDNSSTIIEGDNVQEVIENIITKIEVAQGTPSSLKGDGILINGQTELAESVLKEMILTIADGAITPEKIEAGGKKQILITNNNGDVVWVDASDEVIKDAVKANETVTLLVVKEDGTFTYYNELAVNEKGEPIGEGVSFDANTLSIEEKTPGIFTFSDRKGEIRDLDIRASNIIFDDTTIGSGNDNVQEVIETIFERITILEGKKAALKGKGILISGKESIKDVVLQEVELSIENDAITTEKLATSAVTNAKVANHAITEDKLWVGEGREKQVAVVQNDGSVKFQDINAVVKGKELKVNNSLKITAENANVLLSELSLEVNESGIVTDHIEKNAVTADKIGSEESEKGSVLMAVGSGNSAFVDPSTIVETTMQGDLIGDDAAISVKGGTDVLFGKKDTQVVVSLNGRGVKGSHIATQTILDENIVNATITAAKLTGQTSSKGSVATVIDDKGTVAYELIKGETIADKAALKTDGIILVGEANSQEGTLLKEATLSIANKGINTNQIADNAVTNLQIADLSVTNNKISSKNTTPGSVLISGDNGVTEWVELGDIVTKTAGTLKTDNIINIVEGEGEQALLKNITLGINDKSITKEKLSSKDGESNVDEDMLLVADGEGGFKFIEKEVVDIKTGDLKVGSALAFTENTSGQDAILKNLSIDVAEGGISTEKLANNAVTTVKMSSKVGNTNAANNTVLTADGKGNVAYQKLSDTAFEGKGANLLSDGSLLIPAGNKSVLKETSIGIANSGVQTAHINNRAVTTDKIGAEGVTNNFVLVAKDGGTEFASLTKAIGDAGQKMNSGESIQVDGGDNAVLKEVTISVANLGITNAKIATQTITANKFNTEKNAAGTVLTSLGDGEAKYLPLNQYGKKLNSDSSIEVSTTKGILLDDATIKVKNLGITTGHLGAQAVTTEKISSKVGDSNVGRQQVLMADGEGGVYFGASENVVTKGNINEGATIKATTGAAGAVFHDVTLEVKGLSIETKHIKDESISSAKLLDNAVTTVKINNNAVTEDKIATNAVSKDKIAQYAVTNAKIANEAVSTTQIKNRAVSPIKMSSNISEGKNVVEGQVLTADGKGNVEFRAIPVQGDGNVAKKNITASNTIKATKGATGSVMQEVQLDIIGGSIAETHIKDGAITKNKIGSAQIYNQHITTSAVDSKQIKNGAVYDDIIKNNGVRVEKLSSFDKNDNQAPKDYVLTSNGDGGVAWREVKGGNGNEGGNVDKKNINKSSTIQATEGAIGSVMQEVQLDIVDSSIGYEHLQGDAVYGAVVKEKGISEDKISSEGATEGYVLTADNKGGAYWAEVSGGNGNEGGNVDKKNIKKSSTIQATEGAIGSVMQDVKLEIVEMSIQTRHIADEAVGTTELEDEAVDTKKLANLAVTDKKISSYGADSGEVLTSDGNGGAYWAKAESGNEGGNNNKASMPKFFYLPAIYVDVVSGAEDVYVNVYQEYKEQFSSIEVSSRGKGSSLPVLEKGELDYHVTYYDKKVFYNVSIDEDGDMYYSVKEGAKPTGRTFFNIVLEVKE